MGTAGGPGANQSDVENGPGLNNGGELFERMGVEPKAGEKTACCGMLPRSLSKVGSRRPSLVKFQPTLILVRHSERLDFVDKAYKTSELGQQWPFDAPLTEAGWTLARDVAAEFATLHEEVSFAVVATSPYRRCIETAITISNQLGIPIVLDQEIGEVWEQKMRKDPRPWRSPEELKAMLKGHKVLNPILPEGGFKLFGREPTFPENLEQARKRMVVRFETYIQQSESLQQNFILCTHADGIAAALDMFERGNADISQMDFCSRIIATRNAEQQTAPIKHSATQCSSISDDSVSQNIFAKRWDVESKGINLIKFFAEGPSKKLCEEMHLEACKENQQMVAHRRKSRTKTDKMFDESMTTLLNGGKMFDDIPYEEDEDEDEDGKIELCREKKDGRSAEDDEEEVPKEAHYYSPKCNRIVWSASKGKRYVKV